MKPSFLILIVLSNFLFADFTRSGDIVMDNSSGLQWQDNTDVKTNTITWESAINYCENLTLGGYSDWRLPNISELKSIVDQKNVGPAIESSFINVVSDMYWSSTTFDDLKNYAWTVGFYSGYAGYSRKINSNYVMCVRVGW